VLLRLSYLSVTNVFALLRLLPMSDRDKDVEILALRHQIIVLERQLGKTRPRFCLADRAFLAALLHRLHGMCSAGSGCWCGPRRAALAPGPAGAPPRGQIRPQAPGPAAHRPLHPPAGTAPGTREPVLAVIEHASRRIRVLGATPHPSASWVAQAARNLVMDLEDAGSRARFMIRDRDGKFPGLFDAILADADIEPVLSRVQMPRMKTIMERWVQSCRGGILYEYRHAA
jgi:putative transposase